MSSVPNRWCAEGPLSRFGTSIFVGLYGAINGAKRATHRRKRMIAVPSLPGIVRNNARRKSRGPERRRHRRSASGTAVAPCTDSGTCTIGAPCNSAIGDPRIDPSVEYINSKIDEHIGRRDDEDDALDKRKIPPLQGLHRQFPDAVPGKDKFDHEGAGEQAANLEPDDRHDGDQ